MTRPLKKSDRVMVGLIAVGLVFVTAATIWSHLDRRFAAPDDALRKGDLSSLSYHLAQGFDPNASRSDGRTPLQVALTGEQPGDMVKMLLDAGAEPNAAPEGESPLAMAVALGDIHCIEHLLVAGADPNRLDERGRSPLFLLQAKGARAALIVRRFIGENVDLQHRPLGGLTLRETLGTLRNSTIDEMLSDVR